MKKTASLLFILFVFTCNFSFSQGWLGAGATFYTVNAPGQTSVNVGVMTTNPSANLHVNGTVRLQGLSNNNSLTRILATDNAGNVSYRDVSSITPNAWLLTGNASTNPTVNFVGTTDNQPIVFRTNNTNRMHLLTDGSWRIRPNANCNILIRNSPNVAGENDNLGIDFIRDDAADGSTTNVKARIQFDGYPLTYSTDPSLTHTGYIRFFTNDSLGNFLQRMVITPSGKVAIGSPYSYPSGTYVERPFQVECNNSPIRLEHLPTGTGSVLVIDNNGDVRISNSSPLASSNHEVAALKKEVDDLKLLVKNLKAEMDVLRTFSNDESSKSRLSNSYSLKISPNPTQNMVEISYSMLEMNSTAQITITDLNGKVIKQFNSVSGVNTFFFDIRSISNGTYFCNLIIKGRSVMNKKFVVAK